MGVEPRRGKLWIDLVNALPWLESRPYLVGTPQLQELLQALERLGFRMVNAELPPGAGDVEKALLVELSQRLKFPESGAGGWASYSDRLWDLKTEKGGAPLAIIIAGLDRLLPSQLHSFLRCVHNLLSMTEAVGLSDDRADLQIEYFFIGVWDVNAGQAT